MEISVVLCSYNGQNFIESQFESIMNQTLLPNEIIILDDLSNDNTWEKISEFKIKYSRNSNIKIQIERNIENLGYVNNFEKAISLATGEIIILSDQDDWWYPNKIEKIHTAFIDNNDINFVFSNGEVVDEDLNQLNYTLFESKNITKKSIELIKNGFLFSILMKFNIVTGATMAVKRTFIVKVDTVPDGWVHDAWFSLCGSEKGNYYLINECLIKYRIHSSNNIGVSKNIFEDAKKGFKNKQIRVLSDPYKILYEYSIENGFSSLNIQKTKKKYLFYLNREKYSPYLIKRVFPIFINFIKKDYTLYSNGYKSLLKDLFIKK